MEWAGVGMFRERWGGRGGRQEGLGSVAGVSFSSETVGVDVEGSQSGCFGF